MTDFFIIPKIGRHFKLFLSSWNFNLKSKMISIEKERKMALFWCLYSKMFQLYIWEMILHFVLNISFSQLDALEYYWIKHLNIQAIFFFFIIYSSENGHFYFIGAKIRINRYFKETMLSMLNIVVLNHKFSEYIRTYICVCVCVFFYWKSSLPWWFNNKIYFKSYLNSFLFCQFVCSFRF